MQKSVCSAQLQLHVCATICFAVHSYICMCVQQSVCSAQLHLHVCATIHLQCTVTSACVQQSTCSAQLQLHVCATICLQCTVTSACVHNNLFCSAQLQLTAQFINFPQDNKLNFASLSSKKNKMQPHAMWSHWSNEIIQ